MENARKRKYLEGEPLTEAARPLDLRRKIELFYKVILAVDFLHQHQISGVPPDLGVLFIGLG